MEFSIKKIENRGFRSLLLTLCSNSYTCCGVIIIIVIFGQQLRSNIQDTIYVVKYLPRVLWFLARTPNMGQEIHEWTLRFLSGKFLVSHSFLFSFLFPLFRSSFMLHMARLPIRTTVARKCYYVRLREKHFGK